MPEQTQGIRNHLHNILNDYYTVKNQTSYVFGDILSIGMYFSQLTAKKLRREAWRKC